MLGVAKTEDLNEAADSSDTENAVDEEEVNGNSEESRPLTLKDVTVSEETCRFVEAVEKVEFSSPNLVWIGKIDKDTVVGELKEANGLAVTYSVELTEEQIAEINAQTIEAGDWALISILPFDSAETLTVTMKTVEVFSINVTDANDAVVINQNTGQIQTIKNPSGTQITMFDYWLNSETAVGRNGWPGYTAGGQGTSNGQNDWGNGRHNGDTVGINNGHMLKFVPGADDTASDYWVDSG